MHQMLRAAPPELMADPVMKALSAQIVGRVEKDEGTRSLLVSFLNYASQHWPSPVSLLCPKCGLPIVPDLTHKHTHCNVCKMPYEFVRS